MTAWRLYVPRTGLYRRQYNLGPQPSVPVNTLFLADKGNDADTVRGYSTCHPRALPPDIIRWNSDDFYLSNNLRPSTRTDIVRVDGAFDC
jgi:hypothetical protein